LDVQLVNMSAANTFDVVPSEIISHICMFLSTGQRAKFGETCHRMREVELATPHREFGRISIVWTKEAQSVKTTRVNESCFGKFLYSVEGGN
ncbi:hypothetical protein PFISCL1PPCAC_8988, partial [Pristionchus fissidentatus]